MNYWFLVIICGLMFCLQMALGLIQSNAFSKEFVALRRQGQKVATGKHKALFSAGAIVMFAVTNDGRIIAGRSIKGVTIFARFRSCDTFNGQRITRLDPTVLAAQPVAIRKAIENAVATWEAVQAGRDPIEPPEAFFAFIQQVKQVVGRVNPTRRGERVIATNPE